MPRRPRPLPPELADVFTVSEALRAGVSPDRLRRLPAPFRGIRCRRSPSSADEMARAALAALPAGTALAGVSAARVLGLWLPTEWTPSEPVDVIVSPRRGRPRIAGVRTVRGEADVIDVEGMPVCTPADVMAQLAPRLQVIDLVALGDSAVRWGSGRDLSTLDGAIRPGRRGVRRARAAMALVRTGSASAPETHLRLWLLDAGLPEPELNAAIWLDETCVHGDLVWRDARVVAEYHGAYHFESGEQRLQDFRRMAALRAAGWTVIEVARGIVHDRRRRDALVDEIGAALGVRPRSARARGRLVGRPVKRRRRIERSVPVVIRAG